MALNAQDVAKLAGLARIELSQEELDRLAPQLDIILESISSVSQVASEDIEPTSHPVPVTNVFRADQVGPSWPAEAMLAGAPDVEDQHFRVPRILAEEA